MSESTDMLKRSFPPTLSDPSSFASPVSRSLVFSRRRCENKDFVFFGSSGAGPADFRLLTTDDVESFDLSNSEQVHFKFFINISVTFLYPQD